MELNSENLIFTIHRTHDVLKSREDKISGQHGLTTEQYMVLAAIKQLDDSVRPTDVARLLTHSANSVSMIIDRMVKAGLVLRVRDDENDRRAVYLTITSKAAVRYEAATPAYLEFVHEILSRLSYEEKQRLSGLLREITQAAQEKESIEQPTKV